MHELVVNLHMHTVYSDGTGLHKDIANAALQAGLDVVIVTDHNVLVHGPEGYYEDGDKRVLLLVGEEVHNQVKLPQKSHLLAIGVNRDVAAFAEDPQLLINAVRNAGGLAFLAHPNEVAAPSINESAITWDDWQVVGYAGLEIWNGFSEIKTIVKTKADAVFYAYFPELIAHGADPATLKKWDELLSEGWRVAAIGGSDAHALKLSLGPLHRTVFPYEFHFSTINTHVLVSEPLTGEVARDKHLIYEALAAGHAFVGYDLPGSTRGFRFTAQGKGGLAWMGDEISSTGGITFQVRLPHSAAIHLIKNGKLIKRWRNHQVAAFIATEPGIYRAEVYRYYMGKMRGWIYSNPIYVT
jgi:hypothetical protein